MNKNKYRMDRKGQLDNPALNIVFLAVFLGLFLAIGAMVFDTMHDQSVKQNSSSITVNITEQGSQGIELFGGVLNWMWIALGGIILVFVMRTVFT